MNELKEVVWAKLKLHPINSLLELMDYAQWIDEKNLLMEKCNVGGNRGGLTRSYNSSRIVTWDPGNKDTTTKTRETSSSSESNIVKSIGAYRGRPFRRLSDAEFQERAKKELHYCCDGKFGLGHTCTNKQFQVLILGEGQDGKDEKKRGQDIRNNDRVFSCPCIAC